jgi:hypothetical protein
MSMPTNLDSLEAEGTIMDKQRSISADLSLVELVTVSICVSSWFIPRERYFDFFRFGSKWTFLLLELQLIMIGWLNVQKNPTGYFFFFFFF